MIRDKLLMFPQNQALTATADSDNILDVGQHGDDIQRELTLFVQFRGTGTSAGASTLTIALKTSATLTGAGLDLRLYKAMDGDPSCCPSGEEALTLPLP